MIQKMIVLMKKVAMLMTSPPSKKVKQTEKNNRKNKGIMEYMDNQFFFF